MVLGSCDRLLAASYWLLATRFLATTYEDKPSWLFSHHFNDDSFVALAVEFGVEDLLPGAEV
jgi:hypothetical protein